MSKTKQPRRFVKERRRNACPACLDRNALTITGQKVYEGKLFRGDDGICHVCNNRGYIYEDFPVGNEWRRYPWVITG